MNVDTFYHNISATNCYALVIYMTHQDYMRSVVLGQVTLFNLSLNILLKLTVFLYIVCHTH